MKRPLEVNLRSYKFWMNEARVFLEEISPCFTEKECRQLRAYRHNILGRIKQSIKDSLKDVRE